MKYTVIYKHNNMMKHETFKTQEAAEEFLQGCKNDNCEAVMRKHK